MFEKECKFVGIDVKEVEEIAKELNSIGEKMEKLGIMLFDGSGSCTLRYHNNDDYHIILGNVRIPCSSSPNGYYGEEKFGDETIVCVHIDEL